MNITHRSGLGLFALILLSTFAFGQSQAVPFAAPGSAFGAGFQTRTIVIPKLYAHAYDVEHAVRGFNPAMGTLKAIHFDITVTSPSYVRRTNSSSVDCVVHLGEAHDACTVTADDSIVDRISVYFRLSPPFGDGSQFLACAGEDIAEPDTFVVPANTPTFPGTFYYWNGSTTLVDAGIVTDPNALAYFTGRMETKHISTRTFQAIGSWGSAWWSCCSGVGGGEQNDFGGIVTMRGEFW